MATATNERAISRYLERYAQTEIAALPTPCGPYRQVLVIPAYEEAPTLLCRLDALFSANHALLIILVINRPNDRAGPETLAAAVTQRYQLSEQCENLHWYRAAQCGTLLVVDRFTAGRGIAAKQGVGLARKIGCDIACRLIQRQQVAGPWIFSSDADVQWPANYFTAGDDSAPGTSALSLRFSHQPQAGLAPLPTQLYEFSLHYYVLGLAWAGSHYAHHSLGSTLAVHYQHYARVRGFPKRAAGEDFYLLNKLAKSGAIASLNSPEITIIDRQSTRAPFGTGAARARIDQLSAPLQHYPLYHPQCFVGLKQALQWLHELSQEPTDSCRRWQQRLEHSEHPPWLAVLATMDTGSAIAHAARHSRDSATFNGHLQQWLDGFRTLKLIHALRDQYYPSLGLAALMHTPEANELLPSLPAIPAAPEQQLQWLQHSNQTLAAQLFT